MPPSAGSLGDEAPKPKRSKAPLVSGLVVLVALVVAGGIVFTRPKPKPVPDTPPTSITSDPKPSTGNGTTNTSVDPAKVTVAISSPSNAAQLDPDAPVPVSITVQPSTAITTSTLMVDNVVEDTQSGTSLTWHSPKSGPHVLQANVVVEGGASSVSSAISVTVRSIVPALPATPLPAPKPTTFTAHLNDGAVLRTAPQVSEATVLCQKCLHQGDSLTVECWVLGGSYATNGSTSDRWARVQWVDSTIGYVGDVLLDTPKVASPEYQMCP